MPGDDNAKTFLGIRGAEDRAERPADGLPNRPPVPDLFDADANPSSSPAFFLDDSSAFRLGPHDSPEFEVPKEQGLRLQGAEESINRRQQNDSVLGASSLDSLDWDLGDDYDPPSGFDRVMARPTPLGTDIGVSSRAGDSLPSTSSLFGANYRGATQAAGVSMSTLLMAGDSASSLECPVPGVEALAFVAPPVGSAAGARDAEFEVDFEDVVADDGGTEITEGVPAVMMVSRKSLTNENRELTGGEEIGHDPSAVELNSSESTTQGAAVDVRPWTTPSEAEDPATRLSNRSPFAPASIESESTEVDPFGSIESAAPIGEPDLTIESLRTSVSRSNSAELLALVEAHPRLKETPLMSIRYDSETPIITAPVVARRRPTPPSSPAIASERARLVPSETSNAIRYVLAAIVVIGLIAALLLSLR